MEMRIIIHTENCQHHVEDPDIQKTFASSVWV